MKHRYLIFGGTGSLGKKLIERLATNNFVHVYSRDEAKHWTIRNELTTTRDNVKFHVGDVRDKNRIHDVMRMVEPSTVIMAAALKQVDTCELSPGESMLTNVIGTTNVIDVVNSTPVPPSRVLFVSTDKACAPVNVYGMCKSLSERIVTSQALTPRSGVKYVCVRYGNVLESRGSIIPLFKYQAENTGCLTVTDPNMTRFVMTLDDSVDLIEVALSEHGVSGDTWIPRLPSMKIGDLAEIFAERFKAKINIIGLRPGEKLHEDLINESESCRVREFENGKGRKNYVIGPAFLTGETPRFTYTSNDDVMTKVQLSQHLSNLGIIDMPLAQFKGLSIEEIVTNRNS